MTTGSASSTARAAVTCTSGLVAFESASPPADLGRIAVRVQRIEGADDPGEVPSLRSVPLDGNGRLTIRGVLPGPCWVVPAIAPPGFVAVSSVFSGIDTPDFPLEVRAGEDVSVGVLTFAPRMGELSGEIQGPSGEPRPEFTVVLYAEESRYWTPQARRVVAVRPSSKGQFRFNNLPAGGYRLAAVIDVEPGQWFDPAFLKSIGPASIGVTIEPGANRQQNIRINAK